MSKKETIAVALLFSMTTILKICSVVALYSNKSGDLACQRTIYLAHNTIKNDLLYRDESINAEPQVDLGFKHTIVATR